MLTNPKMLKFTLTSIVGSLVSVSSTSWYSAWMGLEINLLSFSPLISKNNNQRICAKMFPSASLSLNNSSRRDIIIP